MPQAATKPTVNTPIEIRLVTPGKRKPGKWDGAHWWVQVQTGTPFVPIKDTFIQEWRYPA